MKKGKGGEKVEMEAEKAPDIEKIEKKPKKGGPGKIVEPPSPKGKPTSPKGKPGSPKAKSPMPKGKKGK